MKAATFNSSAFNRFKAGMALVASAALVMTGFGYLPSAVQHQPTIKIS